MGIGWEAEGGGTESHDREQTGGNDRRSTEGETIRGEGGGGDRTEGGRVACHAEITLTHTQKHTHD